MLEGLKITNWYKYVMYVAGVTLILSFFLPSQITTSKILHFSIYSIFITLLLWIIRDVFDAIAAYYEDKYEDYKHVPSEILTLATIYWTINVIFFMVWVIFALVPFF